MIVALGSCGNSKSEETLPEIKDITESVYASVQVKPQNHYYCQPLRPGIINEIYVNEGDLVVEGQVLFQIHPTAEVKSQLVNTEIDLKDAKFNYLGKSSLLKNIELEIETATEQLLLDSINFRRQESLLDKEVGKKIDYDQAKLKYQKSILQLNLLNQKLIQTQSNLQSNYRKALSRNKSQLSQLEDYTMLSAINGKVYSIEKKVGDLISSQERFAYIGSSDEFTIEMNIDEVDITKIEIGDTAILSLDAYPEEVFSGLVSKIYPKKNELTQTFLVEAEFINPPSRLYDGLAGEANIVVSKRRNALVIPADYLQSNGNVLTKNNGEVEIKLGVKNLEFVEVLSGINKESVLLKPED